MRAGRVGEEAAEAFWPRPRQLGLGEGGGLGVLVSRTGRVGEEG
jgi:hypothetical protein